MSEAQFQELKEVCDEVFEYDPELKKQILDACFSHRLMSRHLNDINKYLQNYLQYSRCHVKRIGIIYQYY